MSLLLAVDAGGTVNYVLTCATGTYTYTGQAATLSVTHSLVCANGAYTYTGQAATLNVAHRLACDAGSYAYTGNDATLTYVAGSAAVNYTLACDAGSYAYAGSDAVLTYVPIAAVPESSGGWEYFIHYHRRLEKLKEKEKRQLEEIEAKQQELARLEVLPIEKAKDLKTDIHRLSRQVNELQEQIDSLKVLIYLEREQLLAEQTKRRRRAMTFLLLAA